MSKIDEVKRCRRWKEINRGRADRVLEKDPDAIRTMQYIDAIADCLIELDKKLDSKEIAKKLIDELTKSGVVKGR